MRIKFRVVQPLFRLSMILINIIYHMFLLLCWPYLLIKSLFCKWNNLFKINEQFESFIPDIPIDEKYIKKEGKK